ncbi:MAG: phospholipid carrier-dependent glycosyltransferase [Chromatiales bacterium]|nr:phospholipid carrier-dependent glycosyltransferase [Chromatiales bacterium]
MDRQRTCGPQPHSPGVLVPEPGRRPHAAQLRHPSRRSRFHPRPDDRRHDLHSQPGPAAPRRPARVHLTCLVHRRPAFGEGGSAEKAAPSLPGVRLIIGKNEFWLGAAALLTLAAGLGLRDPWAPDEPRYALIAAEMMQSGDWSVTRLGGVIYAQKPPVYFWLLASAQWLAGFRFGFLLPSLLAGLGTLVLVWDLARRLWSCETAWWAALGLLACLQFTMQARSAQIDAVLVLFTTLSLYGLLRHLLLGPDWRWFNVGLLAAGAGVMTKGVGFLPLLVLLPWAGMRWAGWSLPRLGGGTRWLLGPAAFLAPLALWLVPLLLRAQGDPEIAGYLDNLLFRQTITRYADPWHHFQPFWYFFVEVIPWAWFPLVLLLPWLVVRWARRWRDRDASVVLLAGWIVLVLLFFTVSSAKRDVYLLPAAPALALLSAPHLPELAVRLSCRRILRAAALLLALVLAAGSAWLLFVDTERLAELSARYETGAGPLWTLFIAALVGAVLALAVPARRTAAMFAAFMLLGWHVWGWVLQPQINDARSGGRIAARTLEAMPGDAPLGLAHWRAQQVLHLDRPAVHFQRGGLTGQEEMEQAAAWLAMDGERRLLVPAEHRQPCFGAGGGLRLGYAHRRDWVLLSSEDLSGACTGIVDPANQVRLPALRP